jgi:hypothetical protein
MLTRCVPYETFADHAKRHSGLLRPNGTNHKLINCHHIGTVKTVAAGTPPARAVASR